MKLYFTRHGQSEANILEIISNRDLPHALTEKGQQQARALAGRLSGIAFERILSSPNLRARQTSEILSNCLDVPCDVDDGLREFDCGVAEGRGDEEAWQMWQDVMHAWMKQGLYDARIEEGESWLDVQRRFNGLLDRLTSEYRDTRANFILVGHGGTFRIMFPTVFINYTAFKDREYPNTVLIVAELTQAGLYCLSWE